MTAACVDTLDGWQNFIKKSVREVMLGWYASGNGNYDTFSHLFEDPTNPVDSEFAKDDHNHVFRVLKQGKGYTAHPLICFVKGTNELNSWWGSRWSSWVSSSKLYSHACRIEADNKEGNFASDKSFAA